MSNPEFDDYLRWRCRLEDPVLELDLSHSGLTEQDLSELRGGLDRAVAAMVELEGGAIANQDEQRMSTVLRGISHCTVSTRFKTRLWPYRQSRS